MSTQADLAARAHQFFTFEYDFATHALLASVVVGAVCGFVGVFLVLRRMALLGDAAAHATLPGVIAAFMLTGSSNEGILLTGALVTALLAVGAVNIILRSPRARSDAAIGTVLAFFFGVGIVLLSYLQSTAGAAQAGLTSFLLGNAAAVSQAQLVGITVVSGVLIAGILVFLRPLTLTVFDRGFAEASGIATGRQDLLLTVAVASTVVVSVRAVGAILVIAMLILPPSAALLSARRMPTVLTLAALLGALSGAFGAFGSFMLEGFGTGPTMVLAASLFFFLAWVASSPVLRRLVSKR